MPLTEMRENGEEQTWQSSLGTFEFLSVILSRSVNWAVGCTCQKSEEKKGLKKKKKHLTVFNV